MDLKIKLSLSAVTLLGLLATVSAQVDCYTCSYSYSDSDVQSGSTNDCINPVSGTTTALPCTSSQSCYVESIFPSSSSVPNQQLITFNRGCRATTNCNSDCNKDPRNCRKCCSGNLCNTATLESHLSEFGLSQTCYKCGYSEVPGTRSDTGCGLAFDASGASSEVYTVECPGLCFSAKAKFDGVEDIIRGCLYHGNQCAYDGYKVNEVPASVVDGRDNVKYDLACCTGDRCNSATALNVGLAAVVLSTLLGTLLTLL